MADYYAYGSAPANWQGWMGSTYTGTDTSGTWHFDVGIQAINGWHYEVNTVHWSLSFGGSVIGSGSGSFTVGTNGWVTLGSCSVTKTRTHARQDFGISFSVWISGTSFDGTSSWSGSDWLGGKAAWAVSYDGNGGSTPGSQTKWNGEALTLAGAPSRAGYGFDGWSGSDGQTYAAGASYTANAAVTLTAKWHQLYVPPACTLKAVRTASASSTAEAPAGGYAYVTAVWKVDTSVTSGNSAKSVKIEYRTVGASSWTTASTGGTQTGTSGTATAHFAAALTSSYEVRATLTDAKQATSWTATLGTAAVPFDVGPKGRSIGLLGMASDKADTIAVGSSVQTKAIMERLIQTEGGTLYGSESATGTYIIWRRRGLTVTLQWKLDQAGNGYWVCDKALPASARPKQNLYAAGVRLDSGSNITNNTAYCFIGNDGLLGFQSMGSGAFNAGTATWQVD